MHNLAFKRYTQIYALLYTVMFMMTYISQMSLDDDYFLVKIQIKISKMTVF